MLNPLVLIWNRFGLKKENGAAGIRTGVPESPRRRPAVASPLPGRCPAVARSLPSRNRIQLGILKRLGKE